MTMTGQQSNYTAQTPQLWESELFAQAENLTFWHRFEGPEGSGMPIIRKDDLTKVPGDTIKSDMVLALTGAGVTGDSTALHGNAEGIKFRQTSISVSPLAHAVEWTELTEVLITHDMRSTALNQLQKWLSGKFDDAIWKELVGTGSTTLPTGNKWFAGTATDAASVGTGQYVTLSDISDLKAYAQSQLKVEPLRTENGDEYFGLALHPYSNLALKKDSSYQQAQREANVRGGENPLFTGSVFVWDGVIGYVSNRVPTAADGAGSVAVARNVFFGAQAASRGFAQYPDWREEMFDYARQAGVATTTVKGEKLNVFDLSAAGDASGNTAIGSAVLYAYAGAPTA